jgi:hypothetical protein
MNIKGWVNESDVFSTSFKRVRDNMIIELINDCGEEYDVMVETEDDQWDISNYKNFEDSLQEAIKFMKQNP